MVRATTMFQLLDRDPAVVAKGMSQLEQAYANVRAFVTATFGDSSERTTSSS